MHEALQDFQQAVGLQHVVPEVMGLPVPLDRRVARPVVIAAVEGQEVGLPDQYGQHIHQGVPGRSPAPPQLRSLGNLRLADPLKNLARQVFMRS